jgi:tRNA (mo5U34)-methyltransferase
MMIELQTHFPQADWDALAPLLDAKARWINQDKKGFLRYRRPMQAVADLRASSCDFSSSIVRIGLAEDLSPEQRCQVNHVLRGLMPWRKGPFSVFGIDIDAEWQSNRKWQRLEAELPELSGKTIGDIGCNNGYYMFRMAHHHPAFVLGMEPYAQHYFTFHTLNGFAGCQNLTVELLGIEHLPLMPTCFDVLFCLGILYHRSSPIDCLRDIHRALKPGGFLLLESQAIPGQDPVALFPERTYAKVPGTWFVPTAACLEHWLQRTGFSNIRCFCTHAMNGQEQRKTDWMVFESYTDFIDKDNPSRTIEGYPAPIRVFFKATK